MDPILFQRRVRVLGLVLGVAIVSTIGGCTAPRANERDAPEMAVGVTQVWLDPMEIRVVPGDAGGACSEVVVYGLTGLRSGAAFVPFAGGRVTRDGDTVRITRGDGLVTEHYERIGGAIEQRFVVRADPRIGETFVLTGEVGESVEVRIVHGAAVLVRRREGSGPGAVVARVTPPRAFDAHGREIDARFVAGPGRLDIEVRGARAFPVLVDPVWTSSGDDLFSAGPFDHAHFGTSVAGAGDVNGDGYGDFLVGAPGYTPVPGEWPEAMGRAYLYLGAEAGPSTIPAWTASGDAVAGGEVFGEAVAGAGDVNGDGYDDVIVGAPGASPSLWPDPRCILAVCTGKAYLFLGSAAGLDPTPAWTSQGDMQSGAHFGVAVSSAGDVNGDGYDDVIIGADLYNTAPPPVGEWQQAAGKAYLYLGGPSGLSLSPAWTSSGDDLERGEYGRAVSAGDLNGDGYDDVVVGTGGVYATPPWGKVFVYLGSPAGLAVTPIWTSSGNDVDWFGRAVSAAGDVNGDGYDDLLVGGGYSPLPGTSVGKVYLYLGSPAGPELLPAWTDVSSRRDRYGAALSLAGDVNADGYDDILVGNRTFGIPTDTTGRVYLYLGGATGPSATPVWTSMGDEQAISFFGGAVSIAGDVNGDGYADVLVGASHYDTLNRDAGKVYLYLGANAPTGVCDPAGVPCDDGNVCTVDSECDGSGACIGVTFMPAGTPCEDGDPCSAGDACDGAGACAGVDECVDAGAPDGGSTTTDAAPAPDAAAQDASRDASGDGSSTGGCACRLAPAPAASPAECLWFALLVSCAGLLLRTRQRRHTASRKIRAPLSTTPRGTGRGSWSVGSGCVSDHAASVTPRL